MKALAKMEELAPLRAAAEFSFEFRDPVSAPNPLLVMEDVDAGYPILDSHGDKVGGKTIVQRVNFSLQTGQRIGLLGVNGAGKSTLIKTIANELAPLNGKATLGKGLVIGYFAQHQVEMLRHDESPLWHLQKIAPTTREQELRNFLGGFNFPGDMVSSPIRPFSGGEKARLALALIVWQRPNLLLLDEPTNHLDLETREALTMALAQFEGTLVVVSHDRHLLRATTEEFIIVAEGRLQPFDGDLDDYKNWLFQTKLGKGGDGGAGTPLPSKDDKPAAGASTAASAAAPMPAADRKEQKRLEAEERQRVAAVKKPIENRVKRLEEQMAKLNARKSEIDARLLDPAIYEADRKDELKTLVADQAFVVRDLGSLEEEWLELQEQLESLAA
jgi:ATP-binding cassette subfamily F protein 3